MNTSKAAFHALFSKNKAKKSTGIPLSAGMVLVTLGIVYGDIGTSPMYTMKAIIAGNGGLLTMSTDVVLGALSLIIWTLTLITTVKYVMVAMKADNHNEGGIFALYSLVKKCAKWLIIPAMIGGAALLADGILTPAVTVTTAIEGLRTIPAAHAIIGDNQHIVVMITIIILCTLFALQKAGTSTIGKAFGPVMTLWFLFLGAMGVMNMFADISVVRALNPVRGILFLFDGKLNAAGLMVLGSVFLCTTGAEALYSDMGHVGKSNIYVSWPFVKVCLILNYLGQGAWLITNHNNTVLNTIKDLNPFFEMLPGQLRPFAVILSALAAIIASQALITGSYSIVSEAIKLDLMPHIKINYPSTTKGQIYIPLVNNIMWVGCIGVVLLFQSSEHMEAAYGLAITVTMLMTSILLYTYLAVIRKRLWAAIPFILFFGAIEAMFFFSSLTKFFHGGYFTVLMATAIFVVMFVWRRGTAVERTQSVYLPVDKYIDQLRSLSHDADYTTLADNLVFLTNDSSFDKLDRDILYSILDKRPKRAKAYYFINISLTDDPNTREFIVNDFGTDFLFKITLRLGFRVNQRINTYLYQIVGDLIKNNQLAPQNHKYSIYKEHSEIGDFRFCLLRKVLAPETDINGFDARCLELKYFIRRICGSPARWYGLENSNIVFEYVPLFSKVKRGQKLTRITLDDAAQTGSMPLVEAPMKERIAEIEEDEDIFAEALHKERVENAATVADYVGGDTASFRPLKLDEEEADEDVFEEQQDSNH
ncbi:MAG: KUP/HAK/KT family potassium transporter [Atopobium sp.]|uniref:KUP/HAK/KT family potassium transporter n=1 Tax=Atopobiaceae TaxID=1643824 RepID=UPI000448F33B|nr:MULTISPECIES: KUP/HAK/KT family potassium transporter [Atopobiaceae]EWC94295.1 potassium transporter [Atopobium sp. BS2]MBF0900191.1 KUP/HAK/KT family potassium transporter [Atopobium sp.]MBS6856857.1 KUP/HAK/KT family potassium transporter [Atopobium sp.]MDU5527880.1 KUP/HAK/KT family potassium transporter [Atopobium sp.]